MKNLLFIIAISIGAVSTTMKASSFSSNPGTTSLEVSVITPKVNLLCTSIAKGDFDIVKKLVASGESVNVKSNGLTPSMYAAKYNRVEILKFLIAEGAKLKVKCDKGYTALEYAQATNAKEAQAVIEAGLKRK